MVTQLGYSKYTAQKNNIIVKFLKLVLIENILGYSYNF